MAKEKVKLSLEQESDCTAVMTSDEVKALYNILKNAANQADDLTVEKNEGRVLIEMGDGRVVVSVKKAKIEKDEED